MFSMELKPAPLVKATINVGCGLDIPTGTWHKGKFGENILNGGLGLSRVSHLWVTSSNPLCCTI